MMGEHIGGSIDNVWTDLVNAIGGWGGTLLLLGVSLRVLLTSWNTHLLKVLWLGQLVYCSCTTIALLWGFNALLLATYPQLLILLLLSRLFKLFEYLVIAIDQELRVILLQTLNSLLLCHFLLFKYHCPCVIECQWIPRISQILLHDFPMACQWNIDMRLWVLVARLIELVNGQWLSGWVLQNMLLMVCVIMMGSMGSGEGGWEET
jgi:hypothetical protein